MLEGVLLMTIAAGPLPTQDWVDLRRASCGPRSPRLEGLHTPGVGPPCRARVRHLGAPFDFQCDGGGGGSRTRVRKRAYERPYRLSPA